MYRLPVTLVPGRWALRCLFRRPAPLSSTPASYLCSGQDGGSSCLVDSNCGSQHCNQGICVLSAATSPCASNFDCVSGVCDVNNGICKAGGGETCAGDYDCTTKLCLASKVCQAAANGMASAAACTSDSQCASLVCDSTEGKCVASLSQALCTANSDCLSTRCLQNADVRNPSGTDGGNFYPASTCDVSQDNEACRVRPDCRGQNCVAVKTVGNYYGQAITHQHQHQHQYRNDVDNHRCQFEHDLIWNNFHCVQHLDLVCAGEHFDCCHLVNLGNVKDFHDNSIFVDDKHVDPGHFYLEPDQHQYECQAHYFFDQQHVIFVEQYDVEDGLIIE
ncbi:unnamed protein product [Tilletia controversa]|nr:unnamed protein product [Tilletia controversa]